MTYYINKNTSVLLSLADDGSEDSFITEGFRLATRKQVDEFLDAANSLTPEQALSEALTQRDSLLATAGLRISPLQDAVDDETATAADIAKLKEWKQYRGAVNRVPDQPNFPKVINWPAPPN
ncbi:tail fiber assembly protein [Pseudomonas canadensis]|uniref:tail fiber assembly protein n=1 Tax=Pseudomonas canadensis TaxID=915099 RepID=UPI0030D4FF00